MPGRPAPVLTAGQRERAGWVVNGLLEAVAPARRDQTGAVLDRVCADPRSVRAEWLAQASPPPPIVPLDRGADTVAVAVVEVLAAVVGLREDEDGRRRTLSRVASSFAVDPDHVDASRIADVAAVVLSGAPVSASARPPAPHVDGVSGPSAVVGAALLAGLDGDRRWAATGRVPATVRARVAAGVLLAGPGVLESAAPHPAVGAVVEVVDLAQYPRAADTGWRASPFVVPPDDGAGPQRAGVPAALVIGESARGWFGTATPSVYTDDVDGWEVRVTAVPSQDGGRALLRRLGAETRFDGRRPEVEVLPSGLGGDGVVLHRQVVDGPRGLSIRIDLVRNVGTVDVVLTTIVDDPTRADAAAVAMAFLAAAVEQP